MMMRKNKFKVSTTLMAGMVLASSMAYAKDPVLQTTQLNIEKQAIPPAVVAPSTHEVLTLVVTLENTVEIGDSDTGARRYVPITGGYFKGKTMSGTVLSGGADWQLQRPDGVLEIDALYSIKTDDGQTIIIHNSGLASNDPLVGKYPYIRTIPQFKAPKGKYDWLNKRVFTGTITPIEGKHAVIIRVFQVD